MWETTKRIYVIESISYPRVPERVCSAGVCIRIRDCVRKIA